MIRFKMVPIHHRKPPSYEGWHNLCLDKDGEPYAVIAGPIDPETSKAIMEAIENERHIGAADELRWGDT